MNLSKYPTQFLQYIRSKKKRNLAPGIILSVVAIILAVIVVNHCVYMAYNVHDENITGATGIFNEVVCDFVAATFLLIPCTALFAVGYLLIEGHSLGWKTSYIIAVSMGIVAITGIIEIQIAVLIIALLVVAATIGLINNKRTPDKDTPTTTEATVRFGLKLAGAICLIILFGMFAYIAIRGSGYANLDFITRSWDQPMEERVLTGEAPGRPLGGLSDYVIGSLLLVVICDIIAVPLGVGAAVYLAEYAPKNMFTDIIRFFIETLAGVPSVVIGLVGAAIFVTQLGFGASILSGGLALMMMILPWNIRVAEEAMRAVPQSFREASYALGATKSETVGKITLYAASPGVITGIILGVGKAIGETAVILLTVGPTLPKSLPGSIVGTNQFVPALPIWISQVRNYFIHGGVGLVNTYNVIYAGALTLIIIFLIICITGLYLRNHLSKKLAGR
ncbi:MAG: phosphate ABC transporter permease PstA [Candidatus Bathyarchaeota archaeon]|nr:phosphate ABC transporter permease PstA [Candidatus Bathyarchaeota archaeon]